MWTKMINKALKLFYPQELNYHLIMDEYFAFLYYVLKLYYYRMIDDALKRFYL